MAYGGASGPIQDRTEPHGAVPASVVRLPAAGRDTDPSARPNPFPELDCIRDRLSPRTIAAAERRSVGLGVGADRVLITHGFIDEEAYLIALARWLGWDYETFDNRNRYSCPLPDTWLINAARYGLLPLKVDGVIEFVVAPRSVRAILNFVAAYPASRFRLTSTSRLNDFISTVSGQALGKHAAHALLDSRPDLSSGARHWPSRVAFASLSALLVGALVLLHGPAVAVIETMLTVCFLSWLGLRLVGCFLTPTAINCPPLADRDLPIYTIIVALYREAAAVEGLIRSLREIDYPPEKLDIKLVIEADDEETRAALNRLDLGAPLQIIVAPQIGPQTKPKALNAALPFAKGTFTVVYDAEDRPEPDQLRRAVATFAASASDVACVQARLTIDNTDDGWLPRTFTAEYAAQFDLFMPGLARMGLPLPLGRSSNHFRSDVLRKVGAWDPYNVTEDADLGMRLARFGFRSIVIDSTTYEEAPARFAPWVRQRTRWFKGWMQTWLVHMRHPIRLLKQLGLRGFLTFQLVVGGNVLAALIHPFFAAMVLYALATGQPLFGVNGIPEELTWAFMAALLAGYLVTVTVGIRGLARRGLLSAASSFGGIIVHWLMLSLAAWRAVIQLVRAPHRWEKTTHGLAINSRLAGIKRAATSSSHPDGDAAQRRDAA